MSNIVISCDNVVKNYQDGNLNVAVLKQINLTIEKGESVCIVGASGSGKSTLLHLLRRLDKPTAGDITLMEQRLVQLNQRELGELRNRYLGFVYQFHHLLPEFTAQENVMMPLLIAKKNKEEARQAAAEMLDKVGLKNRAMHRPGELSGGERQRAAIARALVTRPACILADEPTGNLDRQNAANVLRMMMDLKNELGTALVVVTHDDQATQHFDRVMTMQDGILQAEFI